MITQAQQPAQLASARCEVPLHSASLAQQQQQQQQQQRRRQQQQQQVLLPPTVLQQPGPPPGWPAGASAAAPDAELPTQLRGQPVVVLGADQQRALDAVLQGHCIFLTGGAGVGKSLTLEVMVQRLRRLGKVVAVTASTGTAAVNIGGLTIHSWAGLRELDAHPVTLAENVWGWKRFKQQWRACDVLLLDEASMVDCELLEMVDYLGRYLRGWRVASHPLFDGIAVHELHPEPFGGLQVVAIGDFFQLPPVDKRRTWEVTPTKPSPAARGRRRSVSQRSAAASAAAAAGLGSSPDEPDTDDECGGDQRRGARGDRSIIRQSVPVVVAVLPAEAVQASVAARAASYTAAAQASQLTHSLTQMHRPAWQAQPVPQPCQQLLGQQLVQPQQQELQLQAVLRQLQATALSQEQLAAAGVLQLRSAGELRQLRQQLAARPDVAATHKRKPGADSGLGLQVLLQGRGWPVPGGAGAASGCRALAPGRAQAGPVEQARLQWEQQQHSQQPWQAPPPLQQQQQPQAQEADAEDADDYDAVSSAIEAAEQLHQQQLTQQQAAEQLHQQQLTQQQAAEQLHQQQLTQQQTTAAATAPGDALLWSPGERGTMLSASSLSGSPPPSPACCGGNRGSGGARLFCGSAASGGCSSSLARDALPCSAHSKLPQPSQVLLPFAHSFPPTQGADGSPASAAVAAAAAVRLPAEAVEAAAAVPLPASMEWSLASPGAGSQPPQQQQPASSPTQCPPCKQARLAPARASDWDWERRLAQAVAAEVAAEQAGSPASGSSGSRSWAQEDEEEEGKPGLVCGQTLGAGLTRTGLFDVREVRRGHVYSAKNGRFCPAWLSSIDQREDPGLKVARGPGLDWTRCGGRACSDDGAGGDAAGSDDAGLCPRLPVEWRRPGGRGKGLYCFRSPAWAAAQLKPVVLKQHFRQRDPALLKALEEVRRGQWSPQTHALLQSLQRPLPADGIQPTQLVPTNCEADRINTREYQALCGPELVTPAIDRCFPAAYSDKQVADRINSSVIAKECVRLKPAAQVMLLWNLDVAGGLANGTRGVVERFVSIRRWLTQEGALFVDQDQEPSASQEEEDEELLRSLEQQQQAAAAAAAGPSTAFMSASALLQQQQQQQLPRWSEAEQLRQQQQQQPPRPEKGCCGCHLCPCSDYTKPWSKLDGTTPARMTIRLPDAPDGVCVELRPGLQPYKREALQQAVIWLNHTNTKTLPLVRFLVRCGDGEGLAATPAHEPTQAAGAQAPAPPPPPPGHAFRRVIVGPQSWQHTACNRHHSRIVLSRTQLPLCLSWAITVHKSQGMSITRLRVILGRDGFAAGTAGMVYVALSRTTSREGLEIVGALPKPVADVDVSLFYHSHLAQLESSDA